MMPRIVSASRISRTSRPVTSSDLSPFTMCRAFPGSEYYGDSVAVGLAPGRPSHALPWRHVRAKVRCSVRPVGGLIARHPDRRGFQSPKRTAVGAVGTVIECHAGGTALVRWNWSSSSVAFTVLRKPCGAWVRTLRRPPPLYQQAMFPARLSTASQLVGLDTSSRVFC